MHRWTAETARIAALISHQPDSARNLKSEPVTQQQPIELPAAKLPARVEIILEQMEQLDRDFKEVETSKERLAIVSAKEKLWKLIYPGQGNLKPAQRKPAPFQPEPLPLVQDQPAPAPDQQPAIVVPTNQQ